MRLLRKRQIRGPPKGNRDLPFPACMVILPPSCRGRACICAGLSREKGIAVRKRPAEKWRRITIFLWRINHARICGRSYDIGVG